MTTTVWLHSLTKPFGIHATMKVRCLVLRSGQASLHNAVEVGQGGAVGELVYSGDQETWKRGQVGQGPVATHEASASLKLYTSG